MICDYTKSQIYRDGYQKALWDVKDWFERHSWSLKTSRMYNKKSVEMLLNAICKGADTFMEHGADTAMLFDVDKENRKKILKIYVGKGCEDDVNEVTKGARVCTECWRYFLGDYCPYCQEKNDRQ